MEFQLKFKNTMCAWKLLEYDLWTANIKCKCLMREKKTNLLDCMTDHSSLVCVYASSVLCQKIAFHEFELYRLVNFGQTI